MRVTTIAFAAALGTAALCGGAFAQAPAQAPGDYAPGAPQSQAAPNPGGNTQTAMRSTKHKKHTQNGAAQDSNGAGSNSQAETSQGQGASTAPTPTPGQ